MHGITASCYTTTFRGKKNKGWGSSGLLYGYTEDSATQ